MVLQPILEFKTHDVQAQFLSPLLDSRLVVILYSLAGFVYFSYGKSLTLTELIRTQAEQDAIYGNDPAYQQTPWKSVHQFGRGADISIFYFTPEEQKEILKFLNTNYIYAVGSTHETGLIHEVGTYGLHLHLQVSPENQTIIKKLSA